MTGERPLLHVGRDDGARLAVFEIRATEAAAPAAATAGSVALLLVHGTGSDHTTWRVTGPRLAARHRVYALDRRGRGASRDGPTWKAGLEVDDVIEVARAAGELEGAPVLLVGHSFGGRVSLAAAAHDAPVRGVVAIEAAPMAPGDASRPEHEALLADLRADVARADPDAALARFLLVGAGLPAAELESFRASPLWPERVRTAPTVVRELDAALHDPALAGEALIPASVPVLQVVGTESPSWFREAATVLGARLPAGRLQRIDGAGHGAHHSHPDELASAIEAFLVDCPG